MQSSRSTLAIDPVLIRRRRLAIYASSGPCNIHTRKLMGPAGEAHPSLESRVHNLGGTRAPRLQLLPTCQPFLWQLLGVGWGSGWLRQDEVPVALTHNSPGQLLSFLRSTSERAWYSSQPQPPSPTPCTGSSLLAWWAWASPTP